MAVQLRQWKAAAHLCDGSQSGVLVLRRRALVVTAKKAGAGGGGISSSGSNYVVPLDKSTYLTTRPLAEILRDLNKRIPQNILNSPDDPPFFPWYQANRMLSFYAPGWCGEIRHVIFSDNATVTVVYRVTITGSDGQTHRESSGTVSTATSDDPVAAAEEVAFCRACARFGLGLYLYHHDHHDDHNTI